MSRDEVSIIGKLVKDMYGTTIGSILGTLTHIDCKIQTVGIDCGSEGLKQIPYEQLVLQGDVVICIPGWRIDAQKILREKRLTLSRLKALMGIMSENDATQYSISNVIVFDQTVFNQDIYITHKDVSIGQAVNYYLELEQVKLAKDEAAVATLKDMRGRE